MYDMTAIIKGQNNVIVKNKNKNNTRHLCTILICLDPQSNGQIQSQRKKTDYCSKMDVGTSALTDSSYHIRLENSKQL